MARKAKLTDRGVGVVAVVAGVATAVAMHGHLLEALMAAYVLYLLRSGRAARLLPTAKQSMRAVCWIVAAGAALMALNDSTAPGGATLGLSLAVALATALRLTRHR